MAKKAELVKFEPYQIMQRDPRSIIAAIEENLGGELTAWDLERVKIPTGGGTAWAIPDIDADNGEIYEPAIDGVIIYSRDGRVYWSEEMGATGGTPPDCFSNDGLEGFGEPGGKCAECPFNQWGTKAGKKAGEFTRGKACKQVKSVFIVTKDKLLPMMITLPPTSLKEFRKYMGRLCTNGLKQSEVVTRVTLSKATSSAGIVYAQAQFTKLDHVPDEYQANLAEYATAFKRFMDATDVLEAAQEALENEA